MSTRKSPFRFRTRYLIQPKFQLLFSGILILIAFISALFVGILIYLLIYANNLIYVQYNIHTSPEYLNLLEKQGKFVAFAWVASFLVVVIILLIAGIFLSHRMVGPIYAFMREMKKIKDGDFTAHLELRKKDEFKELKIPFNQWAECLRKMTQLDIENISALKENLKTLIDNLKHQNAKEEDITQLQKILDSMEEMMHEKSTQLG